MTEEFKMLVSQNGVSGNENSVGGYISSQIMPYADKVYTDIMGNVVAVKRGSGSRIMFTAHADAVGIAATFVDEQGFVRVAAVGKIEPRNFSGCHLTFENGVRGVFICPAPDSKMSDCFADIGAASRAQALEMLDIGMTARFDCDIFETDSTVTAAALDGRLGCYVLMQTLKQLPHTDYELYFVFTGQSEVGNRGARVAGFDINPDVTIDIGTADACDTPECEEYGCKLHDGAAIKIRDASVVCSTPVINRLEKLAKENGIRCQRDVSVSIRSDIGAVQMGGRGSLTGGISIPLRYRHTTAETASKKDIEAVCELLGAYIASPFEE